MGPDLDLKGKSRIDMEIFPGGDGNASKGKEKMTCAKNCEDNSFLAEALPTEHTPGQVEYPEINVTDVVEVNDKEDCEIDSEEATEYSSSFSGTDSETGNGPNGVEVESQLHDDGLSSLAFDTFDDLFRTRKKKLTAHWRKFIQPLMWRCKWAELQVRELQAQKVKYERKLAECDQSLQHDIPNFTSENSSVKSTPITCLNRKVNIMKRRNKRKRVEDETDTSSYMSQHNLFSTLGNKKSFAGRSYLDDDFGKIVTPAKSNYLNKEFDVSGGWPCLEFKDDNTLEQIMQKIDESQLQLRGLKVRMDKLIAENVKTIFSNCEASAPKPMPHENGDGPAASFCTTSHNKGDVAMPDSAVSSDGEITPLLDMVESSDKTHIGVSSVQIKDEVLIKEEIDVRPVVESSVSKQVTPKNKRKRARRRARFTKYRRISG